MGTSSVFYSCQSQTSIPCCSQGDGALLSSHSCTTLGMEAQLVEGETFFIQSSWVFIHFIETFVEVLMVGFHSIPGFHIFLYLFIKFILPKTKQTDWCCGLSPLAESIPGTYLLDAALGASYCFGYLGFRASNGGLVDVGVSLNGGTPKSSIFNRVFPYKPSSLPSRELTYPPDIRHI